MLHYQLKYFSSLSLYLSRWTSFDNGSREDAIAIRLTAFLKICEEFDIIIPSEKGTREAAAIIRMNIFGEEMLSVFFQGKMSFSSATDLFSRDNSRNIFRR
jgi:hypothetical protein